MGRRGLSPLGVSGARRFEFVDDGGWYDPQRFIALMLVALVSLVLWVGVVVLISPHRLLTYLAFFIPLWFLVMALTAGILYRIRGANSRPPLGGALRASVRHGALLASAVVANLAFAAAHKWNIVTLVVVLTIAGGVELIAWARTPDMPDAPRLFR